VTPARTDDSAEIEVLRHAVRFQRAVARGRDAEGVLQTIISTSAPSLPRACASVRSPARGSPAGTADTAHGCLDAVENASDVHWAMKPPSTVMVWPVTNEAAPEHSQITASATSSG
jgi:hypothetical protein